jgi:hypothetical protein
MGGIACRSETTTVGPVAAISDSIAVAKTGERGDRTRNRERPALLRKLTIKALHMTCAESCPTSARIALRKLPEVYQVAVDLGRDALFVSYDGNAGDPKHAAEPMLAALASLGFDPWFKAEGWPDDVADETATVVDE